MGVRFRDLQADFSSGIRTPSHATPAFWGQEPPNTSNGLSLMCEDPVRTEKSAHGSVWVRSCLEQGAERKLTEPRCSQNPRPPVVCFSASDAGWYMVCSHTVTALLPHTFLSAPSPGMAGDSLRAAPGVTFVRVDTCHS
jgi:hypothetical protein